LLLPNLHSNFGHLTHGFPAAHFDSMEYYENGLIE